MSSHYLKTKGMTIFCQDYLVYHYFGKVDEHTNLDLVGLVRDQLHRIKSPRNLGLFMESYSKRDAIKINRPVAGQPNTSSLKCGVLILTGDHSPAVDDTVNLNSKLDPTNTSWIKISDASSLVLEEQPTGVTNALVLFLQGHGYGKYQLSHIPLCLYIHADEHTRVYTPSPFMGTPAYIYTLHILFF